MGRLAKGTPEIRQAFIEVMLQNPNFSDFQIAQIISERFAIRIARTQINRNSIKCLWGASNEDLSGVKFQREKKQFKSLSGSSLNLNSLPLILAWAPSSIGLQC
jgi:hypothetical protein